MTDPRPIPPAPRAYGAVNWLGLKTLAWREIRRFIKVHTQTIWAPVITTLLFLAVFALALGGAVQEKGGVPFVEFLVPGLIIMAMAQNAFANTSSSIIISKVQGNIVDTLMPPLSPIELVVGFAAGGIVRGMVVGGVVAICLIPLVTIHVSSPFWIVFHGLMASTMLSLLGIAGGVWSEKFDHIAAVTNFIVTPLSFLSGTFYTIDRLPDAWRMAAHFNPFFYMIDGFRYGFIGHTDTNPLLGAAVMLGVNAGLALLCWRMFARGYKLRA